MGNCWYDLPFLPDLPGMPARPGLREGPVDMLTDVQAFPRRYWSADFVGLAILPEFMRTKWEKEIEVEAPPAPDSDATRAEITQLLSLMDERAATLEEIRAQSNDFPLYFLGLLMMNRASHPATYEMMKAASRVGEMLMCHFKMKFNRPRPHQLCPALMPPVTVPGHASYPSGHGMIAHLLAHVGAEVRPDASASLFTLAERIARNREVAGLHYPSDSRAGAAIAENAFKVLLRCRGFQRLRDEARAEWAALGGQGGRRRGR